MTGNANRLRAAQRELIDACGGQDGAAVTISAMTGQHIDQRRISDALHPNKGSSLRVHHIVALEDAARRDESWPIVTRMMAAIHGFSLFKLPDAPAGAADWLGGMSILSADAGAIVGDLANALKDGDVDGREAEALIAKIDKAMEALVALRTLAAARAAS